MFYSIMGHCKLYVDMWVTYESLISSLWVKYGSLISYIWVTYGSRMGHIWVIDKLYVSHISWSKLGYKLTKTPRHGRQ